MMETEHLPTVCEKEVFMVHKLPEGVDETVFDEIEEKEVANGDGESNHINGTCENSIQNGTKENLEDLPDSCQVEEAPMNGVDAKEDLNDELPTSGSSEEDLPLACFVSPKDQRRSQTPVKIAVTAPKDDSPSPKTKGTKEKPPQNDVLSPLERLYQVRGRPGLRSGSPLNKSFTVRSEPSTPSGIGFPGLRKATAELNLFETGKSRKRKLEEFEGEGSTSPTDDTKRQKTGWWGLPNLARFWGSTAENIEASPQDKPENTSQTSTTRRACSLM